MPRNLTKIILASVLLLLGPVLAELLRPTELASYIENESPLSDMIPRSFGGWQEVSSRGVVRPQGDYRAATSIYDQELYRVYRDGRGNTVMFVVAFGHDQSDSIQLHRPEVCYRAGGFKVSAVEAFELSVPVQQDLAIPATRLNSKRLQREEPVTYWTRVGAGIPSGVVMLQLEKLWTGLKGQIPDGALVRISSIGPDPEAEFALHQRFVSDLLAATGEEGRAMLIGERANLLPPPLVGP